VVVVGDDVDLVHLDLLGCADSSSVDAAASAFLLACPAAGHRLGKVRGRHPLDTDGMSTNQVESFVAARAEVSGEGR